MRPAKDSRSCVVAFRCPLDLWDKRMQIFFRTLPTVISVLINLVSDLPIFNEHRAEMPNSQEVQAVISGQRLGCAQPCPVTNLCQSCPVESLPMGFAFAGSPMAYATQAAASSGVPLPVPSRFDP